MDSTKKTDVRTTVWCPYIGAHVAFQESTLEHIIPLSLGGHDHFTVRVLKGENSGLGAAIDAALGKEFPIALRRIAFNVRGQSDTPPRTALHNSFLPNEERVSTRFKAGEMPHVVRKGQLVDLGQEGVAHVRHEHTIKRSNRYRFLAKAVLSGGYFLYREAFRQSFQHERLRQAMHMKDDQHLNDFGLYMDVSTIASEETNVRLTFSQNYCRSVDGSCLVSTHAPGLGVFFSVGILGEYLGSVIVAAELDAFTNQGDHRGGQIVTMERRSKRFQRSSLADHDVA